MIKVLKSRVILPLAKRLVRKYGRRLLQLPYLPISLDIRRFDSADVERTVNRARARFPNAPMYLLTDAPDRCGHVALNVADVQQIPPRGDIAAVVLAFDSDEQALRHLRQISARRDLRFFCADVWYPTARYFHRNDLAKEVLKEEAALRYDKFDTFDFENIIQAIELTRAIPGDYVEIGVYKGTSARVALKYFDRSGIRKQSWFLDTFEGFRYDASEDSADAVWYDSHRDATMEGVTDVLSGFITGHHVLKRNIIIDDLPAEIGQIALCNVDVDMYEAVVAALHKVALRIPVGGIIIAEDQGHTPLLLGGYAAVNDFLTTDVGRGFIPVHLSSGQMYLVRVAR